MSILLPPDSSPISVLQMVPGSPFLDDVNNGVTGSLKEVEYSTIAGDVKPWPLPSDTWVWVDSVRLIEVPYYRWAVLPVNHTELNLVYFSNNCRVSP